MRKLPPLNSIRAFEAATRHQSFTAAAAELSVTLTAVSHQIRQLEARIGHRVVVSPSTQPKKGLRLFTAWLYEEAQLFSERALV